MPYWRGVFVSYRRADSQDLAGRLTTSLTHRFGPWRVFRDHEGIGPGEDWLETYRDALDRSRVVLVVIGPDWNPPDRNDPTRRRLDNEGDHVRSEVALALANPDTRVVPLLVDGASLPSADELPDDLDALRSRDAVRLDDESFRGDVDALASGLPIWPLRRLMAAAVVVLVAGLGAGWFLRPAANFDGARDVVLARTSLVNVEDPDGVADVSSEIAKGLLTELDRGGGISVHGADAADAVVGVNDPLASDEASDLWERGAEFVMATELSPIDDFSDTLRLDGSLWVAPFSSDLLDDLSGDYRSLTIDAVDPAEPSSLQAVRSQITESAAMLRELLLGLSNVRLGQFDKATDRLMVGLELAQVDVDQSDRNEGELVPVFQFFLGVAAAYEDPASSTAAEWFELAHEADPAWARPMLGLADVTFRQSNGSACVQGVDNAGLARTADQLNQVERLMAANPGPQASLESGLDLGRGRLLLCREFAGLSTDYAMGLKLLEKVAADGERNEFAPTRAALALELLGHDAFRLEEYEQAAERYERARRTTKLPAARCRNTGFLVDTNVKLGRIDDASSVLAELEPCVADGHVDEGLINTLTAAVESNTP